MAVFVVAPSDAGARLDIFLAHSLPGRSRARATELIASDAVRVNGRRQPKGASLRVGDEVAIDDATLRAPEELVANPDLEVTILLEDAAVIAVDKPAGMPSHVLRHTERETVANFLVSRYPELRTVGSDAREAGLVHRLDTDTSGVLLVARTAAAHAALRRQFTARTIRKEYLALVHGNVMEPGEIRAALAHDPRSPKRMQVVSDGQPQAAKGRPAITRYQPREQFGDSTLLAVEIPTGVMHQIRAHLAWLGHPVVGDELYGPGGPTRQLLHAERITFTHPVSDAAVTVSAPLPADFLAEVEERRARLVD